MSGPAGTALPPWDLVLPGAGPPIRLPVRGAARRRMADELRYRPAGTRFLVLDQGPLAGHRLAQLAREASLALELEYLAVPSLATPLFLVERSAVTQTYFATQLLTVPPHVQRGWAAAGVGLQLLRRPRLWELASAGLCGRVTIWRRA